MLFASLAKLDDLLKPLGQRVEIRRVYVPLDLVNNGASLVERRDVLNIPVLLELLLRILKHLDVELAELFHWNMARLVFGVVVLRLLLKDLHNVEDFLDQVKGRDRALSVCHSIADRFDALQEAAEDRCDHLQELLVLFFLLEHLLVVN